MIKRRQPPSHRLTIYLLKEECDEKSALKIASSATVVPIRLGRDKGVLTTSSTATRRPRWAPFLDTVAGKKITLETKSASAALLIRRAGRVFAVTFGHGRSLLRPSCWEERFGLIVALNAIPADRIRSADFQSFESVPSQRHAQGVGESTFADFGLDVERDLLRAAVGKPEDPSLGSRMSGADALQVHVSLKPESLGEQLERYLRVSEEVGYRDKYPWIDRLAAVKDRGTIAELDEEVLTRIKGNDIDRVWLAPPERVETGDVAGFRYGESKDEPAADIHLAGFLDGVRDVDALSVQSLKVRRVHCVAESSDAILDAWSVYNCLYAEHKLGDALYVLTSGKWYKVEEDFAKSVEKAVRSIKRSTGLLPEFSNAKDRTEKRYLIGVSRGDKKLALMDRKLIRVRGLTPIELCDLLSSGKQFIHVKRYAGSSVLSHLFSQGAIAGQLFARHAEFRDLAKAKLPPSHQRLMPSGKPSGFEVVFAIVSHSVKEIGESLPFFSKLNLRNAAELLEDYGYKVSLAKIDVKDPPVKARKGA